MQPADSTVLVQQPCGRLQLGLPPHLAARLPDAASTAGRVLVRQNARRWNRSALMDVLAPYEAAGEPALGGPASREAPQADEEQAPSPPEPDGAQPAADAAAAEAGGQRRRRRHAFEGLQRPAIALLKRDSSKVLPSHPAPEFSPAGS